jgi:solute carrier family 25 (mitochondrial carnitine/acylcarnitine transporter), member 20/29
LLSGAAAGFMQMIASTPVEHIWVRCQIQTKSGKDFVPPRKVFMNIYKEYGISGLYRGVSATFMREVIGNALYFGFYETMKTKYNPIKSDGTRDKLSFGSVVVFGALSGIAYWLPSYPWDIIKTRMQAERIDWPSSMFQIAKQIHAESGINGFFKGLSPCLMRALPVNAAVFLGFEICQKALEKY